MRDSMPGQDSGQERRRWKVPPAPVIASSVVLTIFITCSVLAHVIAPHDPFKQDLTARLLPPVWQGGGAEEFLLGTDRLGRDVLSRIIFGARISLMVGLSTVTLGVLLGVPIGAYSALVGGRFDFWLMRLVDSQMSIPFLVLVMMFMAAFGNSLLNVILVIGVANWTTYARMARGEALKLRSRPFVEAGQALGATTISILRKHIIPNLLASIVVVASLDVGRTILAEAALSFLGMGVPPPTPSWGRMISEGRGLLVVAWWLPTLPGIAITLVVVSASVMGDWLRDIYDPKSRSH